MTLYCCVCECLSLYVYDCICTWRNLGKRDHLGNPNVDRTIVLRWIFRKWDVGLLTGSSPLRIGTGGGHL